MPAQCAADPGRGQHLAVLTAVKDEPAVALTRHP
jgi:hypothetical protein